MTAQELALVQEQESEVLGIPAAIDELLESQSNNWPPACVRASGCGHPCERKLYYDIVEHDKRPPINAGLRRIFGLGTEIEAYILKQIMDTRRFTVERVQAPFILHARSDSSRQVIKGHIDWRIDGKVVEFKTMAPHIWQGIDTLEDMIGSKYPWVKNYPAQIMMYLLGNNTESGELLIFNKSSGEMKEIPVPLDYEYSEQLWSTAERVMQAVEAREVPDRMPFDVDICPRCDFHDLCLPIPEGSHLRIAEEELIGLLDRRAVLNEQIKALEKEFKPLDKSIKDAAKEVFKAEERDTTVAGNWVIQVKPIPIKEKVTKAYTQHRVNIKRRKSND